jgi:hypothetical protein
VEQRGMVAAWVVAAEKWGFCLVTVASNFYDGTEGDQRLKYVLVTIFGC